MKKILIIAYRFPPNNETGALRAYSWARYFKESGYYPVVITRHWDNDNKDVSQMIAPSINKKVEHVVNEEYEVYYLPFEGNMRTRFFFRYFNSPLRPLYKLFSLLERIATYKGRSFFSMYRFIYRFVFQYLDKHKDISDVVISGAPFELFHLGQHVKKKYGIDWIADYRDPWSTREITRIDKGIYKYVNRIEAEAEKQWLSNAAGIVSVSDYLSESIGQYVQRPFRTIYNGFMEEDVETIKGIERKETGYFHIVYNGNLFDFQPIEIFLQGVKKVIDQEKKIHITFVGTGYFPAAADRINRSLQGLEEYYTITPRLKKEEYLQYQKNADCLLLINSGDVKGIVASKIFDYLIMPVPVLTIMDDHGPVNRILSGSGQLVVCNTEDEVYNQLLNLIEKKRSGVAIPYNEESVYEYSRKNQAKKLVTFMESCHTKNQ